MMKEKLQKRLVAITVLLALACLSSCTTSDPVKVESDFGNSVRHMVEQQKQTPAAGQHHSSDIPTGLDGDSAVISLDQYRSAQKRRIQKKSLDTFDLNE